MKANLSTCVVSLLFLAATAATAPAQSKPAAKDTSQFHSLKEILDVVPKQTLMQLKVASKSEAARMTANKIFNEKTNNMNATLKVRVEGYEPYQNEGSPDKYTITVPWQSAVNFGSVTMGVQIWISLPPESESGLAGLQKGRDATITGRLSQLQITNVTSVGLAFHVNLVGAKVEAR